MVDHVDGIFMDGSLLGICGCKNHWSWPTLGMPRSRLLQFGVNLIVFARTQEGSIANQIMDAVQWYAREPKGVPQRGKPRGPARA